MLYRLAWLFLGLALISWGVAGAAADITSIFAALCGVAVTLILLREAIQERHTT